VIFGTVGELNKMPCSDRFIISDTLIAHYNNNNNNKVTYKQCSLKKNSDALRAYVIQCCRTGVPSGVVQKLLSTVTKDADRLVGCSNVWIGNSKVPATDDCGCPLHH